MKNHLGIIKREEVQGNYCHSYYSDHDNKTLCFLDCRYTAILDNGKLYGVDIEIHKLNKDITNIVKSLSKIEFENIQEKIIDKVKEQLSSEVA